MSTGNLVAEIKALPTAELQHFLSQLLAEKNILEEIERLGYLKLTERAFEFWNDPRENIYQDYARLTSEG
ncbi:hypothetical protein L0337_26835 [candidate division KSB1 bacterium]|nr:hypothetical protein [candidate division KSB1 bacterium]